MVLKRDNYTGSYSSEVERDKDIITMRLNDHERALFKKCQEIIEQPKLSTCIKQMAIIGSFVIQEPKIDKILTLIYENKRKNKETGIVEYEV